MRRARARRSSFSACAACPSFQFCTACSFRLCAREREARRSSCRSDSFSAMCKPFQLMLQNAPARRRFIFHYAPDRPGWQSQPVFCAELTRFASLHWDVLTVSASSRYDIPYNKTNHLFRFIRVASQKIGDEPASFYRGSDKLPRWEHLCGISNEFPVTTEEKVRSLCLSQIYQFMNWSSNQCRSREKT